MNQSRKITEGALLTAIFIVLLLIALYVPVIGIFAVFTLPIPFIIYATKYGFSTSIFMLFVAIGLSLIFGTIASLPLTLFASIGGIFIGVSMHRKLSAYETLAQGSIGFIIAFVVIILGLQLVLDINIYHEMDVMISESMNMSKMIAEQLGINNTTEQLRLLEEQMNSFKDLLPSSIAIVSMLFAFVSQWLSYKIMNRLGNEHHAFPPFKNLNFPIAIIWFYLIAMILSLVGFESNEWIYLIVANVFAITTVFITIQGFSFIFFYADHKKMHKAVPISIMIVSLIMPFLFLFIIRIIGIIDLGFSLKNRIANNKQS